MESTDKTEILEAISLLADQVQDVHIDVTALKTGMTGVKSEIAGMKAAMVTKSYLDDKLADLKGDMVAMLRKEDQKTRILVERLVERKALRASDAKDVFAVRPFAR